MEFTEFILIPLLAGVGAICGAIIAPWIDRKREHVLRIDYETQLAKRSAYARLLASIEELTETHTDPARVNRREAAATEMNSALAHVDLVAPPAVYLLAQQAERVSLLPRGNPQREVHLNQLTSEMRKDLGLHNPDYEMHVSRSSDES